MKLHRAERDNYVVQITTDPPIAGGTWEASFDEGDTWVDGLVAPDGWSWLVAGPDFDAAAVGMLDEGTVLESSTTPLLRLKDDPVLDIQRGPSILLWS